MTSDPFGWSAGASEASGGRGNSTRTIRLQVSLSGWMLAGGVGSRDNPHGRSFEELAGEAESTILATRPDARASFSEVTRVRLVASPRRLHDLSPNQPRGPTWFSSAMLWAARRADRSHRPHVELQDHEREKGSLARKPKAWARRNSDQVGRSCGELAPVRLDEEASRWSWRRRRSRA
jgi:hypothetical protein